VGQWAIGITISEAEAERERGAKNVLLGDNNDGRRKKGSSPIFFATENENRAISLLVYLYCRYPMDIFDKDEKMHTAGLRLVLYRLTEGAVHRTPQK
jgi:hypothetical protein